ncbi:MAG TPA: hypothetical protein VF974_07455 [Patescibacteria group bacterium]
MTARQGKVINKVLESNGKLAVSKAMLDAGYPPTTAKNPQQLTRSKGWQELMEQYLPDNKLLKVHNEGLEAVKVINSHTEPDYIIVDYQTRAKYLELGYKVKGRMNDNTTLVQVNNPEDMNVVFE